MKIEGLSDKRKTSKVSSLPPGKSVLPSLYVDTSLLEDLDRIAKEEDVARTDLIRFILADFVEKYQE